MRVCDLDKPSLDVDKMWVCDLDKPSLAVGKMVLWCFSSPLGANVLLLFHDIVMDKNLFIVSNVFSSHELRSGWMRSSSLMWCIEVKSVTFWQRLEPQILKSNRIIKPYKLYNRWQHPLYNKIINKRFNTAHVFGTILSAVTMVTYPFIP